jgi:regulator of ribonuclease activity A
MVADAIFRDYGGVTNFHGPITTVKCFENNPLVRSTLEASGNGRVLVVDGGGSMRCALLGGNLAENRFARSRCAPCRAL